MVNIKLDINKLETNAERLKAIAHPIRIGIVEFLQNNDEKNVTDIYKKLNINQACASHHLSILKNKNIIISRRDGKNVYYSINKKIMEEILCCMNNTH